jgi:predicted alpha/beta-hydrolase family hydrolase
MAIDLPRRGRSPVRAEQAVPAFLAASGSGPDVVIGGQSYGGRVASLVAAQHPFAALILFSYPLHAPGRPADAEARTEHWPAIRCPVLLLSGDRDPFARVDLLHHAVTRLRSPRLVILPGARHALGTALPKALEEAAAFLKGLG